MERAERILITVDGRVLEVSNLGKAFYPEVGFTKGDVLDYYIRIAPALLPHLEGRPLTLKRYPDGVRGAHFYEKRCPSHRPAWVKTIPIWSDRHGQEVPYCAVDDLATLVWAANLADLELHVSLSRGEDLERPTALVFDLDPGAPADLLACTAVALRVRELFRRRGLSAYPKTSGGKGMQVYVPLNTAVTYAETKPFARAVAETLEAETPDLVTSKMTKALRPGKVFVDWSQNDSYKTTVCVYSLRARERPTVSTPLTWREVEAAHRAGDASSLVFEAQEVLERFKRRGDLFAPLLQQAQALPASLDASGRSPAASAGPARPAPPRSTGRSRGDRGGRRAAASAGPRRRATGGRRRRTGRRG